MSIYKSGLDGFTLTSTWQCSPRSDGAGGTRWAITNGPTEETRTLTFPVSLPAGAIIARAWIGVSIDSSPKGGIAYFRMNGEDVSSGEVNILLDIADTSYSATFAFKSWGTVEETLVTRSGALVVGTPTLYVDYVDTAGGETGGGGVETASSSAKGMRLPRLLDENLREKTRLNCISLSVTENIDPLSTADMTLPHNAPVVDVDDFVELFTPYGSAGVYRVYQTTEAVLKNRKCALRHGIVTLADDLVSEGNAIAAPVAQVFASLFAMQSSPLWVMGECDTPEDLEIVLERNHQSLLNAFTSLTANLPEGYAWQFDQTILPWRAHLREMPTDDSCEFRMKRDIAGMSIRIDRDSQCTRVYAFGAGEGDERITLTGLIGTPYLDADDADRIIAKSITNEEVFDALTLQYVAEKYLERHKDPTVSIEIDAANIYRQTGLAMDKFHLGKVCRVPLPTLGRTIREKVISIRWRDLIKSPDAVTATLANRMRTVSDEMADLMREATNGKLIGGTVVSKTNEYNNGNVTQVSSLVHEFAIKGYGNVLSVLVNYTPAGKCLLLVDSEKEVPADEAKDGSVDVLRYLKSDENGIPLVGQHNVQFFAIGTGTIAVHSEVTVKTIEKHGGGVPTKPVIPQSGTAYYTSDGAAFYTSDSKQLYLKEGE